VGGVNGGSPAPLWEHWDEVERRLAVPAPLLACFDYDGTLTPIRERPEEVVTPESVADALRDLAARAATAVAVVSGRRVEELRERLPAGLWLVGCHGLALVDPAGSEKTLVEDAGHENGGAVSLAALRRLGRRFERCLPGARLEEKGIAIAFHTRSAPREPGRAAARVFAGAAAGCRGLRVIEGKEVVEVLPEGIDKGTAVTRLRDKVAPGGAVLYIGDDTTDEDAFAELAAGSAVTVLVGPPDRPSHARYRVAGCAEVEALVRRIAELRPADRFIA
jgi:trehalose-phosphatase